MEQAGHTHIRHRHGAGRGYVSVRIGIALNRFISVHRSSDLSCHFTLRRDTVKCQLMDPVTHRMGKGIYMYQYDVPVPPMALRRGQTGQVRIIHLMQREVLPGIHDVGVLICR